MREPELSQTEVTSTAEDPTPKDGPQLALMDKPRRVRPRFDASIERECGRKVAERAAKERSRPQRSEQEHRKTRFQERR